MKHILFLLLLLPLLAYAQFPASPNKIRLGNQTTADGLVVRTAASPSWTPSSINNAWLAFDTVAVKLYYYDAGTWNEYTGGSVNIGNTDLTLTGNRRLNTGGYQFWIQDGTGSEVPYIYIGGDQVSFAASTTTSVYLDSSEQRAAIAAGAVIDIDADSIRIIGTQPNDNSLNRLLAWDSITNRLHYVDKASITGSGGTDTNFATDNLTFSGNRVHNLSTRTLTIADGGTYPTFQQSAATDGFTLASSATDVIAQTPGLLQIENSDTITITADRIRMNAADTRIQQVPNDNALNRLAAIDSLTGRLYYVDKSSIAGGGGTVTGTGTTNTLAKWTSSTALGNSLFTDDGTNSVAGGTSSFRLPNGTTAQRPGIPAAGMTRYNTSLGYSETYGASAWLQSDFPAGTSGQTIRHNGTSWIGNSYILSDGGYNQFGGTSWNVKGSNTFYKKNQSTLGAAIVAFDATSVDGYRTINSDGTNLVSNGATSSAGSSSYASIIGVGANDSYVIREFNMVGVLGVTGQSAGGQAAAHIGVQGQAILRRTHVAASCGQHIGVYGLAGSTQTNLGTLGIYYGLVGVTYNWGAVVNSTGYGAYGASYLSTTNWGFYNPAGGGNNAFAGNTIIGGVSTPARTLHVTGEARITDLTTDTPTQIVGADADGDLGAITVGSGLSLSSGTLTATGAGTTNLSFTGSSSPVTLNSDTGTDVIFAAGSGLSLTQSGGTATYSRTYSLTHITITGGSTFFGTTAERPDNDTPGSATTSTVGSDFSVSGSTINYTGGSGALIRVQGSISFSVADDGDYYVSMYKEGTEIGATSMRVSCVAGNYYSISLPATTTSGSTNDTFDLRIATVTGNSTTTMHRYGFILERIY